MATQPRISYKDWLAKRGPKARTSTVTNRDAWRKQMGLPPINDTPKPPGVPAESQSTPGTPPKPPDPWNPTLDYSGVQDENDLTNRYNQDTAARTALNTQRLADLQRSTTNEREAYTKQRQEILSNAAARGLGRSGVRNQNETEAATSSAQRLADIEEQRRREVDQYKTDLTNMATNYQTSLGRNRAAAGQREMQNYTDLVAGGYQAPEVNPNRDDARAVPKPTTPKVTWAQFVSTHKRPRNAAEWAAMRAKYLQRFGNG